MNLLLVLLGLATAHAVQLGGTGTHTIVLQSDGSVFGFGSDTYGQLGTNSTSQTVPHPVQMLGVSHSTWVSAAWYHSCIVDSNKAKCVGSNANLQLGATTGTTSVLVQVSGLSTGVTKVFTGVQNSCALVQDGMVKCWGFNGWGALGDGTHVDSLKPMQIAKYLKVKISDVSIGYAHICLLTLSGKVYCSGHNAYGQLGDGTNWEKSTFAQVIISANTVLVSVSLGEYHTCVVTVKGLVYCFGRNSYGQLGDGTKVDSNLPVLVYGLSQVKSVWASLYNTFALTKNGTALGFGYNIYGSLGNHGWGFEYSPVVFAQGVVGIQQISGGLWTTCVVTDNDLVECLGDNSNGQMGVGQQVDSSLDLMPVVGLAGQSAAPSLQPTLRPTSVPSASPSASPSMSPTSSPTPLPTHGPTTSPSFSPTASPATTTPTTKKNGTQKPTKRPNAGKA
ncbi:hypothetical protein BASA81_004506 [Batrachochytrium salamandrivorans]|nr:hypothetical protein BASA81_004506 [Batrachochytrium salamandrivorans]